jgi:glycosyltransferase involved in cell wall biosynthesis
MGQGLAVIAARSAGTPEVVGDAGLLVQPRDPADIARAIAGLAAQPDLMVDYGRRGQERVTTLFNWANLAERYVSLYQDVAHRAAAARQESSARVGSSEGGSHS